MKSLHFLYQLAKPGSHLWPSGAIESIVDMALETEATQVLSLTLGNLIFDYKNQFLNFFPIRCYQIIDRIAESVQGAQKFKFKIATILFQKLLFTRTPNCSESNRNSYKVNIFSNSNYWDIM